MVSRSSPVGPTVKSNLCPVCVRIVVDHAADHAAHGAGGDHLESRRRWPERGSSDRSRSSTIAGADARHHGVQAWPTSLDSMPGRMPIFCSARSYLRSTSVPKIRSGSALQCSQPLCWISFSSWPGAQPA